jgi:hypothetical protein
MISSAGYTVLQATVSARVRRGRSNPHQKHQSQLAMATVSSQNWGGYVAQTNFSSPANNAVSAVYGTWTVPTLGSPVPTCTTAPSETYCAIWVGIDGFSNGTVEQLGTEHEWSNGVSTHYAWFEMYPAGSYEILGFPVRPGDSISAVAAYTSTNQFTLVIQNNTARVAFTVPASYTRSTSAQRSSAEWIIEAPYENGILPLSNFGTINMTNCTTVIQGVNGAINNTRWQNDDITMVTSTGQIKSASSALTNGTAFTTTWFHD